MEMWSQYCITIATPFSNIAVAKRVLNTCRSSEILGPRWPAVRCDDCALCDGRLHGWPRGGAAQRGAWPGTALGTGGDGLARDGGERGPQRVRCRAVERDVVGAGQRRLAERAEGQGPAGRLVLPRRPRQNSVAEAAADHGFGQRGAVDLEHRSQMH